MQPYIVKNRIVLHTGEVFLLQYNRFKGWFEVIKEHDGHSVRIKVFSHNKKQQDMLKWILGEIYMGILNGKNSGVHIFH